MAQERSHAHQVSPSIERMLAKAVAEGVRSDILEASQPTVLGDQQLNGSRADPIPALTDEKMLGRNGGPNLKIAGDRPPSIDVQRQDPELVALARTDSQDPLSLGELDIRQHQVGQLTDTDPCVAKRQHDRQITRAAMALDCPYKAIDVALLQPMWRPRT